MRKILWPFEGSIQILSCKRRGLLATTPTLGVFGDAFLITLFSVEGGNWINIKVELERTLWTKQSKFVSIYLRHSSRKAEENREKYQSGTQDIPNKKQVAQ
jgi:hypothetical protein